jgi:hypothetical protein
MGFEGTMMCEGCKRAVSVIYIKYMPKGTGRVALCRDCLSKATGKSNAPKSEVKISEKSDVDFIMQEKKKSGTAYYCKKCNYKFRSSSSKPVCGYCGRPDSIEPC